MQRYLLVFLLSPIFVLLSGVTHSQDVDWHLQTDPVRVVNIIDEPRHRTVHMDGQIRLLDVQINPGDTTLPHTHDAAILYTFISNGAGPLFGRVSSIVSYVEEQYTHRVSNEGPGLSKRAWLQGHGHIPDFNSVQRVWSFISDLEHNLVGIAPTITINAGYFHHVDAVRQNGGQTCPP